MEAHHRKLMIPGPVDVEDDVLAAMAQPSRPHYGAEWIEVYDEVLAHLKNLYGTRSDLFLLPGAGSAGLDAALGSLLQTGERVLIPHNGFFGRRLVEIADGYGVSVRGIEAPLGEPIEAEAIRRVLQAEPNIRAIAMVHLETSTGVLNPLREVAAIAADFGVPIIADAVASLGGIPLLVDEWGIDICVSVINKCLGCPPGLSPVSVSPRAWDRMDSIPGRAHGWYMNLQVWRDAVARWAAWQHPYPTTMPTHNILGLLASLRKIMAAGIQVHYDRHIQAARIVRSGLQRMGFELFSADEHISPLLTAVRGLPGMDLEALRRFLSEESHILVADGLEDLSGKILRVGHIGRAASTAYSQDLLDGIEAYLSLEGYGPAPRVLER